MSNQRKTMSGLGSVRRDWSESSVGQAPKSSQDIPWDPTPPKAPGAPMTGPQKRLRAIQDALAACQTNTPPEPLKPSEALNRVKRPSLNDLDGGEKKKRRQLPPSWSNDSLSSNGFGQHSIASSGTSRSRVAHSSTQGTASSSSGQPALKSKDKVASVFLSSEQTHILKLVQDGNSLFYTGSAGTGKSVLLREIIKVLRKKHAKSPDAVAITASTGIAACNIGGVTIHSFSGIGLGVEPAEDLATKVRKNRKSLTRWIRTQVLIIDEVSMVEADLLDKLSTIGAILRKSREPFGGIQVIVTGDFFQLPPVVKGGNVRFAFESEFWKNTIAGRTFNLTQVFRQKDQRFVEMLNEMRFGNLSAKSIAEFRRLSRPLHFDDGVEPTELFPMREEVEKSNFSRMARLETQQEKYIASDGGTVQEESQRQRLLANMMAPQRLDLRLDAQVMLIKNVDEMLVNGSIGRIAEFVDPAKYGEVEPGGAVIGGSGTNTAPSSKKGQAPSGPVKRYPVVDFVLPNGARRRMLVLPETWKVELPNGEVQVSRTQLPLILCWAMSIHKSQGQTLERVKVDLGRVFEKGQAYVALSRATNLEGLQVLNFDPKRVQAHPKVVEWSRTLSTIQDS